MFRFGVGKKKSCPPARLQWQQHKKRWNP